MIIRASNPLSSLSFLRFIAIPKPQFCPFLHSRLYSPSAAAAISSSQTSLETPKTSPSFSSSHNHHDHPWPEWVAFVDRLKSQGYFPNADAADFGYAEFTTLKDPCISFARDRFDLFRSLSKGDIQAMVEGGCPKLQRKVINSAKRLRVYVGLEEKSVCNICSLQGSCDRAYVLLGESEGVARMVDVMRLLLSYALDPALLAGAGSPNIEQAESASRRMRSPNIEQAESASRRMLGLLMNLSEASTGLASVESSTKLAYKKELSVKSYEKEQSVKFMDGSLSKDVDKKKLDWTCPKCSFENFSRNIRCRKCNEGNPKPKRVIVDVEMKKGDWKCLKCECINFARRRDCFRCKGSRPPRVLEPGDWECSKCDFLNFRRNVTCLNCGDERNTVVAWQEN